MTVCRRSCRLSLPTTTPTPSPTASALTWSRDRQDRQKGRLARPQGPSLGQSESPLAGLSVKSCVPRPFQTGVCRERWELSQSRAYQLIDAAAVSTIVEVKTESQARELAQPSQRLTAPSRGTSPG